jgi:hypothetical protein
VKPLEASWDLKNKSFLQYNNKMELEGFTSFSKISMEGEIDAIFWP